MDKLQCVQVGEQVVELLLCQLVLETRHLGPSQQDDVGDAIFIRGNAILHGWPPEEAVEARAAQVALAVREMALGTARIIDTSSVGLWWVQP